VSVLVADMTHYDGVLSLDPAQNRPLLRLVEHLGGITKAGTLAPVGETVHTAIACPRRPAHRPCPGFIDLRRNEVPAAIMWNCPRCGDEGLIHNYRGTLWDLTPPSKADARAGGMLEVVLSPAEYGTLRSLLLADPDCERTIYAARRVSTGAMISGDEGELEHLTGFIAAEANHEGSRRRQAAVDAVFDRVQRAIALHR
jgi:hypothetical protein